jgi:hypothetical protein
VLVGGLGMGFTLRAVLDSLPPSGRAIVAELNPVVVQWCRGALAGLTARAVDDPRVSVEVADVAAVICRSAQAGEQRSGCYQPQRAGLQPAAGTKAGKRHARFCGGETADSPSQDKREL